MTAAEEALAIQRRVEIIRAKHEAAEEAVDAVPNGTPSPQQRRRRGEKTGPNPASVRDLAAKTGRSKASIQRAQKRAEADRNQVNQQAARFAQGPRRIPYRLNGRGAQL